MEALSLTYFEQQQEPWVIWDAVCHEAFEVKKVRNWFRTKAGKSSCLVQLLVKGHGGHRKLQNEIMVWWHMFGKCVLKNVFV